MMGDAQRRTIPPLSASHCNQRALEMVAGKVQMITGATGYRGPRSILVALGAQQQSCLSIGSSSLPPFGVRCPRPSVACCCEVIGSWSALEIEARSRERQGYAPLQPSAQSTYVPWCGAHQLTTNAAFDFVHASTHNCHVADTHFTAVAATMGYRHQFVASYEAQERRSP